MQILIEIDENYYEMIMEWRDVVIIDLHNLITKAITNGTPLPKGHGRLKDVDWIDDNYEHHYSDRDGSWCYAWKDIDDAPNIIEGSDSE